MMERYLTPSLVVSLALGVYFLFTDDLYLGIQQKLASEKTLNQYLLDAENAKTKLDTIVAEYNSFPPDAADKLRVFLPDKIDPLRLIVDVTAMAEKSGLRLGGIRANVATQDIANPTKYLTHTIEFNVSATYPVFREFLRDIQSSLALRDFGRVAFKADFQSGLDTEDKKDIPPPPDPAFIVYDYGVQLTTYSLE